MHGLANPTSFMRVSAAVVPALGGLTAQSPRAYRRNLRLLAALQQERPGRRRGAR